MNEHNRRKFLKGAVLIGASAVTGGAAAAVTQPSILQRSSATKMNEADAEKTSDVTKRTLGSGAQKMEVSAVGLGCMGMSYHRSFIPDKKYMINLIHQAVDLGVNFFDTAEAYGPLKNEVLVGEGLKPYRNKIHLCTKFGFNIENNKLSGLNSNPDHIREVVDQSLKRLGTDHIDLLYQHRVDPNVPVEDVAGTVKDLIKAGKVRYFGMSEASADAIRKAHKVQPLTALQSEFSVFTRQPLEDVIPVCEELGIGFVPYSPQSRGLLSGMLNENTKYNPDNDNRPTLPRYQPDAIRANWPLINVLMDFGNQRGLTAAQVALAWVMTQKQFIVPIPGTTKSAHLVENLAAADYQFTGDELQTLTAAISKINIVGARYTGTQAEQTRK